MSESSLNTAPPAVKQFVERFYGLLDGESPQASEELTAMFDEEAEFITPVVTFKGRQDIKVQREQFWTAFPGLKHQPLRVYVSPSSPLDIIVVNNFEFTKDGEKRLSYTAAEFRLVEVNGARLIKSLQLFMNPAVLGWS
ncbi:hypothetical protein BDW62DRAFT_205017 [Aspergillus aurantiobrunneus]